MTELLANDQYVRSSLYIGGQWAEPVSADTIDVVSPSTEEKVGRTPDAGPADVDAAVRAARSALDRPDGWTSWSAAERATVMESMAAALEARGDEYVTLQAVEAGKPVGLMTNRPNRPAELLRYFAGLARSFIPSEVRSSPDVRRAGSRTTLVRRQTRGVTGAIVPYNAPLTLALYKVGPTLALGGTVVVKGPPQAPLDLYLLAEVAEQVGLPPGVLNILAGGRGAGEALVEHDGVATIGFTGSSAAGARIAEACGRQLKPCTLELGGKSAAILLEDVDLATFVSSLDMLSFAYSGQNCFVHSRILAPRSRYGEVVDAVTEHAAQLVVGDPFDPATQLGPLITDEHRGRVESFIRSGIDDGARVTTGGERPSGLDRGWYVSPTVFADATNDMAMCRQEIFGPVVAIIPHDSEEEAIAIANDTDFGLAGSVWTADLQHGIDVAEQVDTGSIGVNGFGFNTAAPFGGRKQSGLGTELGIEGFAEYVQYQSVHLP